eukprot:m.118270 g.118270  ORF g.118270 m.118270 type:complete len:142 (+) comp28648_c0_seq3:134-559(+)
MSELHEAAEKGDTEGVKKLLKQRVDANAPDHGMNGRTPLHVACTSEQADCVRELITANADVNVTMVGGWTPMHSAAESGSLQCLLRLHKANPLLCLQVDELNDLPRRVAQVYDRRQAVEFLEKAEKEAAEINKKAEMKDGT